jgi:hypothetical protein
MTPEQRAEESRLMLGTQVDTWRTAPITQEFIKLIKDIETNIEGSIIQASLEFEPQTADKLRAYSSQLRLVNQIKKLLYDTESFVKRAVK